MDKDTAVLFASLGNLSAIIFNYWLGHLLYEKTKTKLRASKTGRVALFYGYKYGYYSLILTPLPIIGDPLTIVAGVLRINFLYFFIISGFLRVLRYILLTFMT